MLWHPLAHQNLSYHYYSFLNAQEQQQTGFITLFSLRFHPTKLWSPNARWAAEDHSTEAEEGMLDFVVSKQASSPTPHHFHQLKQTACEKQKTWADGGVPEGLAQSDTQKPLLCSVSHHLISNLLSLQKLPVIFAKHK